MKLEDLIDLLIEIQSNKEGELYVSIMQEHEIDGHRQFQIESLVKDVVATKRGVTIIGKELD